MARYIELFIDACLYYTGLIAVARWWVQRAGKYLIILCYHNASEASLSRHLQYLRRHYRVLHLEEALEELYTPSKKESKKQVPLVLTFDDGYKDNLVYTFALARNLHTPFTIFLVPGYIESGQRFWWQEDKRLLSHTQATQATIEGHTYHLDRLDEREALAQTIDKHVRYATSVTEREKFLTTIRDVLQETGTQPDEENVTLPLTWLEVQTMEESGFVSFGAHTMHHPTLAYLADKKELEYEVSQCRMILEKQLRHPVRTFAYPIGQSKDIGTNGLHAVQEAKYTWAVTTMYGFNTAQTDPYLLRRIVVDVDHHWLQIAAKSSGLWGIFSHLYSMLVKPTKHYPGKKS